MISRTRGSTRLGLLSDKLEETPTEFEDLWYWVLASPETCVEEIYAAARHSIKDGPGFMKIQISRPELHRLVINNYRNC